MNLLKRMFVTCGFSALTAAGLAAGPVQAQDYPTRNITMIVPFAAGGPTDVIARIVTGDDAAPGGGGTVTLAPNALAP